MGFNLYGLLISTNCADKMEQVAEALQVEVKNKEEITFEEACRNTWQKDYLKCYHTSKGSIFFLNTTVFYEIDFKRLSRMGKVIVFELSETSMAFCFRNFENCVLKWEDAIIMEEETELLGDGVLKLSPDMNIVEDVFGPLSAEVTGVNIHYIQPGALAERYAMTKRKTTPVAEPAGNGPEDHTYYKRLLNKFKQIIRGFYPKK